MHVYKVGKCVVVVALALLLLSCASSPARLKPVEEVLGKGWVCYTAPDGYKLAGIVVEVTNDGKYIFDADYSSLSIETQSSIGSVILIILQPSEASSGSLSHSRPWTKTPVSLQT